MAIESGGSVCDSNVCIEGISNCNEFLRLGWVTGSTITCPCVEWHWNALRRIAKPRVADSIESTDCRKILLAFLDVSCHNNARFFPIPMLKIQEPGWVRKLGRGSSCRFDCTIRNFVAMAALFLC